MDKISPEEKIQWMKKSPSAVERIYQFCCVKNRFIIRPLINGLEIIKQLDEAFLKRKAIYRTPAQKEAAVFGIDFLKRFFLRDICARHKISDADTRRWIMKYNSHDMKQEAEQS